MTLDDAKGTKRCRICKKYKNASSDFHRDSSKPDLLCNRCKVCNIAHTKKYTGKKPRIDQFKYELSHIYGITFEFYEELLSSQEEKCAICGGPPTMRGKLYIDHCHKTNKVRGLLCAHCNTGLGYFRDDPDKLVAAAAYLEKQK